MHLCPHFFLYFICNFKNKNVFFNYYIFYSILSKFINKKCIDTNMWFFIDKNTWIYFLLALKNTINILAKTWLTEKRNSNYIKLWIITFFFLLRCIITWNYKLTRNEKILMCIGILSIWFKYCEKIILNDRVSWYMHLQVTRLPLRRKNMQI